MKWINKAFEQSAYEWDLSYNTAWLLFWLPILSSVLVVFSALNRNLFRFLLAEDGPVEWATFGGFIVAMLIGIYICNLCLKLNYKWFAWFFGIFAIAMLFCAGEELSWGQRIFDLETPEELRIPGVQDEIVFHNIGGKLGIFNVALLLVEIVGGFAYFVKRRVMRGRQGTQVNYLFPPLCLSSSFAIALIYKILQLTIWQNPEYVIQKYVEWTELSLAFGLIAYAWLVQRKLRAKLTNPQFDSQTHLVTFTKRAAVNKGD